MTASPPPRRMPADFVAHLRSLAAERPDDVALFVVTEADGVPVDTPVSYAALARRTQALAAHLQRRFAPGARALLLLDNDDHYVVAFLACLHAGLVAVPAFPPESLRPQHLARLAAIARDAQAACLLATRATLATMGAAVATITAAPALAIDETDPADAAAWRPHAPADGDIAFLQYTSGSTSEPKGVMVSHANLMANERAIEHGMAVGADDVFASWLPLYHDMGLIGGLLQPLHRGIPLALMTPQFMLERPLRWLQAIARLGVTISGGPDFAYRLCAERVTPAQAQGLALGRWRLAFSGAEPVRPDTLRAFAARFAPSGFDTRALYPCYGLAEATLFVTGGLRGEGAAIGGFDVEALAGGQARPADASLETARELVDCGAVVPGHRLSIVDPATGLARPEGVVGEIEVAGPSIAPGYWQRRAESAEAFVERDGLRWLRTGDLGFLRAGRLHVTGRRKDLVILRGRNVYPQDVERAVEAGVADVRAGRVAAFAIDTADGERIGIAAEVGRTTQKRVAAGLLVERIAAATGEQCGEAPVVVALLNPGGLPRTSSGKLQRAACRRGWAGRTLDAWAVWEHGRFVIGGSPATEAEGAPLDDFEHELAALWQRHLPSGAVPVADRDAHFLARGGDSIAAARLCAEAGARWRIDLPLRVVFEHPRLAAMATEIRRLRASTTITSTPMPLPHLSQAERDAGPPASHAQTRQWFLWRLDPRSTAYHIGGALRLAGAVDADALAAAVDALVERHESLRTTFFADADGRVRQRIAPPDRGRLASTDLRALPADDREARAHTLAQAVFDRAFDLAAGPLARFEWIRCADDAGLLVVVLHHAIGDAASFDLLIAQLGEMSDAVSDATPAPQAADHAAWQHRRLADGEEARQLAWWRERLGGEPAPLALPADGPGDATAPATRHELVLPAPLVARLRATAAAHDATLFMALLAAFQALLHRAAGAADVRVGVPFSHRGPAVEAVGLFVNTLILRAELHGGLAPATLLAQARAATLGAQANAELPFERLVEALRPTRQGDGPPLFQAMFNHLEGEGAARLRLPGVTARPHPLAPGAAQCELALDTQAHADGRVTAVFSHAPGRFAPRTVARLAAQFAALAEAFADRPASALGELPLLDVAERAALDTWSVNPGDDARDEPVHQAIARQARRTPHATALVEDERRVSYAGLDGQADALARRLVDLGTRPGERIGLAIERSAGLVVALLAVLKAGAAYVPLDPQYPAERLALMIEDARLGRVLADDAARPAIAPVAARVGVPLLDAAAPMPDGAPPAAAVHDESPAYVLYTSGSTGRPKGVSVAHRALATHVRVARELFALTPDDRVLLFATPNFDGFVEQLFPALCAGAAVVLRGAELWDAARFHREVARHGVTVADLTTAYWQHVAQEIGPDGVRTPGTLRLVHVGGEALSGAALRAWQAGGLGGVRLRNTYGPTEACVTATALDCTPADAAQATVPLGAPLAGRALRVLDADLNLVPPGVAGELCIGGPLLAHGYLGRPALSAERFIADPFGAAGARLYRTGDVVRWSTEGRLDYLGRVDHQVKLRGFRVELGEIESLLLAQPGVGAAVVVARDAALAAYVAPRAGAAVDAAALRAALAHALPEYMRPSAIVALERLPLNPNGKVDRHALPAPVPAGSAAEPHEPPQSEAETRLAALWQEVLGVARVGRHDHFFECGGHSIAALRIAALWSQRVGGELPIRAFFDAPTLAGIAARAPRADAAGAGDAARRLAAMDELLDEFES